VTKAYLLFLSLVALQANAWQLMNQWVLPTWSHPVIELSPMERTRPIVMGDIIFYANLSGDVGSLNRKSGFHYWLQTGLSSKGIEGALSYGRSRVYVGDLDGNLMALESRNGAVDPKWKVKIAAEWLSPPAVFRDRVYAMSSSEELYAYSEADGKEIWHYSDRGDEKMTVRGTAGPVVFGDAVFQGFANGYFVALQSDSGSVLWKKQLRVRSRFYDVDMVPHVDMQGVVVATYDGRLYHLDRATGDIKWVFPAGSYGSFLVEQDRIYFSALNGSLYCLNRANGSVVWKLAYERGIGLTPVRVGDYVVFPTSEDPFYVVDSKNGEVLNTTYVGAGTLAGAVGSSDGWFYLMSRRGVLHSYEILPTRNVKKLPVTIPLMSAVEGLLVRKRQN